MCQKCTIEQMDLNTGSDAGSRYRRHSECRIQGGFGDIGRQERRSACADAV